AVAAHADVAAAVARRPVQALARRLEVVGGAVAVAVLAVALARRRADAARARPKDAERRTRRRAVAALADVAAALLRRRRDASAAFVDRAAAVVVEPVAETDRRFVAVGGRRTGAARAG